MIQRNASNLIGTISSTFSENVSALTPFLPTNSLKSSLFPQNPLIFTL